MRKNKIMPKQTIRTLNTSHFFGDELFATFFLQITNPLVQI